jgi:hypothetical protein
MIRFALVAAGLVLLALTGCSDALDSTPMKPAPDPDPEPTLASPQALALPPYSPGDEITLHWTDPAKGGAREYLAQRSADPDFAAEVVATGWFAGHSARFVDVPDGVEQHLRVMARDRNGEVSGWSDVVRTTPDASPPQSRLLALAEEQFSLRFAVDFEAEDTGAGVVETELWVRHEEEQEFVRLGSYESGPVNYVAARGGRHEFRTIARDAVDNVESKPAGDGWTLVPEPVILIDRNDKQWDITNAALRYGMVARRWGHGIGQHSIPPVIDPRLVGPGEPGYPADDERFEILGVAIDGEAHAYRMGDLPNREVVDDVVGGVPIAACY